MVIRHVFCLVIANKTILLMKRQLLLLLLSLFCLTSRIMANDGIVTFLEPNVFQITYPQQFIQVIFKKSQIPESRSMLKSADLNREEQQAIVHLLKNQIDIFPSDFINAYLDISIHPVHIYENDVYGFFYGNKIFIDADKIMPDQSYNYSICNAFLSELAYLINEKQYEDLRTKTFITYLDLFNREHRPLTQNSSSDPYEAGYVTFYPSGTYTAHDEYVKLFAHLLYPETRENLINFITLNPESILTDKINRFVSHLEETIPSLNKSYFFGKPIETEFIPQTITSQDGEELLARHEMKSNEAYDFSSATLNEDYESYSVSNDDDFNFEEPINSYEPTPQQETYEEIETIFNTGNNETTKQKKKKKKRKKDGTGLLIVGSLLYLTLELLSQ